MILSKSKKSWSDVKDKSFDWRDQLKKFNDDLEINFEILWKKIRSGEHSPYSKRVGSKLKHLYKASNEDLLQDRVVAVLPKNPSILRRLFRDKKYNPRGHTRDMLAVYCGYVGWRDLEMSLKSEEQKDVKRPYKPNIDPDYVIPSQADEKATAPDFLSPQTDLEDSLDPSILKNFIACEYSQNC